MTDIDPPWTPVAYVDEAMRTSGFAVLSGGDTVQVLGETAASLVPLAAHWDDLPLDPHLRDGGRYRRRRHGCFVLDAGVVSPVAARPHWQPLEYNALHGGFERWFEPLAEGLVAADAWSRLLVWLGERADALHQSPQPGSLPAFPVTGLGSRTLTRLGSAAKPGSGPLTWFVEAHAFRIETTGGIGRPTPEGAHRDGVDLVAVMLLSRDAVRGGETRVFEADSARGSRFTLREPWSLLLLDDARVVHETTPILPLVGTEARHVGRRDTLVVTLRAGGFQAPGVHAYGRSP